MRTVCPGPTVRFTGRWHLDFEATRAAYQSAAAGSWARQIRAFPELAELPAPVTDGTRPARAALQEAEAALEPFKPAIENPAVLDEAVLIRYAGVHEAQEGWNRDLVGFNAYVSRTDAPEVAPLPIRKHLPEPFPVFWTRVLEAAKALNRPR